MTKEYKFQDEVFVLDDSNRAYLEVTYKDQKGYVGVYIDGTSLHSYCWSTRDYHVTRDGLSFGYIGSPDIESNLQALCRHLLSRHRRVEEQKAFKPEEACESLHEFVQSLPG